MEPGWRETEKKKKEREKEAEWKRKKEREWKQKRREAEQTVLLLVPETAQHKPTQGGETVLVKRRGTE
jgi:hypothetical protein